MVLIRNNVQKESTYGWYPSQVNVYDSPSAKKGYDKECLFRHWQSGLHHSNPVGVSPVPSPGFKGSMKTGSLSTASRASVTKSPVRAQSANLMVKGSRPDSFSYKQPPPQFVFERSRPPSTTVQHIPTPQMNKGYHGWQPQPTIIGVIDPHGPFIPRSPKVDVAKEETPHIETPKVDPRIKEATAALCKEMVARPETPAQQISGSFRAQSASLNRPRVTSVRPVRSAGSRCKAAQATSTVSIGIADSSNINAQIQREDFQRTKTSSKSCWTQPKDSDAELEEELERPATPVNPRTPSPLEADEVTYECQVDKYGWLAEVHGDPFNLKKITERLPYAVKCEEPVVLEYPYKTRVIVGDTYFLNTIPRKPMTFDVHPEWQSEGFVAKRKELAKKGHKFHTRNFGFVY